MKQIENISISIAEHSAKAERCRTIWGLSAFFVNVGIIMYCAFKVSENENPFSDSWDFWDLWLPWFLSVNAFFFATNILINILEAKVAHLEAVRSNVEINYEILTELRDQGNKEEDTDKAIPSTSSAVHRIACPKCRSMNDSSADFCGNCGFELKR